MDQYELVNLREALALVHQVRSDVHSFVVARREMDARHEAVRSRIADVLRKGK